MTHGVSCRCADCRARRAAAAAIPSISTDVAENNLAEEVEEPPEQRRTKGIKRILMGVVIILVALLLVEGIMWLLIGEFGAFGFIDALFVLLGTYHILRGTYEVLTSKPTAESS